MTVPKFTAKLTILLLALVMTAGFLSSACTGEEDPSKTPPGKSSESKAQVIENRRIVFALDATWPPMEYIDSQGRIVGFSVDYMRAAGRLAGFEPVFINENWKDIFNHLAEKKYDAICSSVSITEERKREFDFSVPYFKVRQMLVVRAEDTFHDLADLAGRKVGAQTNTTGSMAIRKTPGPIPVEFDTVGIAFERLAAGEVDAVVCDDPVAAQFALAIEKYKDRFRIAAVLITSEVEYYGVAVNRGDVDTLRLIDKGILAVKESGKDTELLKKWIGH